MSDVQPFYTSKISKILIQLADWGGPIMTFPQLYQIFILQQSQGVSVISWLAYTIVSVIWLWHGYRIQDRSLMINSAIYAVQCGLIAVGATIF
jgi:uncharacterized protein with PQ loop repeat